MGGSAADNGRNVHNLDALGGLFGGMDKCGDHLLESDEAEAFCVCSGRWE
jgi:hypothetical protein